jgi:hypothetical protein
MYLNINGRLLRRLVDFKVVLQAVNTVVLASEGRDLSQVEEDVLRGAWEGLTYPELAKTRHRTEFMEIALQGYGGGH